MGRLDRLKREEYFEMLNLMFVNAFSNKEKVLFQCYNYGLNVTQSISGLELQLVKLKKKLLIHIYIKMKKT